MGILSLKIECSHLTPLMYELAFCVWYTFFSVYMYFLNFNLWNNYLAVDSVTIMTNYDTTKDGPCPDELVVVTCSVVGTSLTWTVTDTSLKILGSNTIIFFANEHPVDIVPYAVIPTTTIDLEFYQTRTTRNTAHPSSSKIESQMQFRLEDGFVEVVCTDSNLEEAGVNITTLGML